MKQWLLVFEGAIPATLDWDASGLPTRAGHARQAQPAESAST